MSRVKEVSSTPYVLWRGIWAEVVKEETNVEKARRLYPKGTRFRAPDNDKIYTVATGVTYSEYPGTGILTLTEEHLNQYVYYEPKGEKKWAEILPKEESPGKTFEVKIKDEDIRRWNIPSWEEKVSKGLYEQVRQSPLSFPYDWDWARSFTFDSIRPRVPFKRKERVKKEFNETKFNNKKFNKPLTLKTKNK